MTPTEQIAADLTLVVNHVLRDEARQYGIRAPDQEHARLAVRVAEAGFANRAELATVMGWVLAAMRWTARSRPLTDDETLIYAAAIRVSEVIQMLDAVAVLGQAIAAGDWDEARQRWTQLAQFHAWLIGLCPDAEYLNIILQDLTQPSIH